ncbi:3,4-dihydroxy-2-butanone-4-phosphate synthase [uncultured Paenibacillus sp.]|uniref:3,4-dihydroxy-2-butanone-4-phosphate synthase n=1 Tax=uncultured Paenibacillus sp. TaxID=227322 RepID=UPI0028D2F139|nr:3,4-dihydroxy-2-butanone-4-phosphate synthase [uncultured Paenibacillus sp.]
MFHRIEDVLKDLVQGKPIIVADGLNRENEGDLVALAEKATPSLVNFMITHARGFICCPITAERANELHLDVMVAKNSDPLGTAFTVSVDHDTNTTGGSAYERSDTIRALASADTKPWDLRRPGHIFPTIAKPGGVLEREGHTEAAIDLAKLCGAYPAAVTCEMMNANGLMARRPELHQFAETHNLKWITVQQVVDHFRGGKLFKC